MSKTLGYIVMEQCEDYQQALVIRTCKGFPPGGLLDWARSDADPRAVFNDRASARAAISRTEHYRLAYGEPHKWPERKFCVVVPLRKATP